MSDPDHANNQPKTTEPAEPEVPPVEQSADQRAPFGVGGNFFNQLGTAWLNLIEYIGGIVNLIFETLGWVWKGLVLRQVRFGRFAFYTQIVRVGVRSVGVIALVSGCIGLILALQMSPPLAEFGQTNQVATIIAIAIVRELGPLISAIVLTGFAGASIAAELGTMKVGEEIEALVAHALNPVRFLVMPRLLATTLCMIIICIMAELIAIGGGYLIGTTVLDIPSAIYQRNTIQALDLADFFTGLTKAGVFGTIIGSVACYNGLNVEGGAAGVGNATTRTVVHCIVFIIFTDLVFTGIFFALGWN